MEETQSTPVSIQDTSNSQTVTISPDASTLTSDNIANPQDIEQTKHTHNFNENCECVCGGVLVVSTPSAETPLTEQKETSSNAEPAESIEAVLSNDSAVAQIAKAVTQPVMQGVVVEEKKREVGRPSKYNEGMLNKAKEYYQICLNGERVIKDGKEITRKKMPLLEELARLCEVDSNTIDNWCDDNEEFLGTIKRIKELQKERVILNGFNAKNPTFSIFMLKANHGMMETEKQVLVQDRDVKVSITRE